MDAQSEWMFTIEEWEADAEVVQAEAEAAKAQNGRPTSP